MKKQNTLLKTLAMGLALMLILTGCPPGVDPNIVPTDVTDSTAQEAAIASVTKGLSDLETGNFGDAQTNFTLALVADPTNVDAQFWVSFMDMASLSVDQTVVDLFKNRIGVSGYPATLDTLFSDTWFNGTYYIPYSGFIVDVDGTYVRGNLGSIPTSEYNVHNEINYSSTAYYNFIPSATGTYYASSWYDATGVQVLSSSVDDEKYQYHSNIVGDLCDTQMLPALSIPSFMAEFGVTSVHTAIYMYPFILAANIAVNNPDGFNDVVDAVNTVALGSTLDTIIARISALSDTARVVIPASLMTAYSSPEAVADLNGATVSLGKAELLLWSAELQLQRAFVQYLASVDFSYDMAAVVAAIAALDMETIYDDTNGDEVPDQLAASLIATPGFYGTNLLKERDASKRTASKVSFVAAVDSLKKAANLLKTQWADPAGYYSTTATTLEMPYELRDDVAPALQTAVNAAEALATAVNNSAGLTLPSDTYVMGAAWPTSADAYMTVYPAAIWASNVLDPRTWFESNATDGFVKYMSYETEFNVENTSNSFSAKVAWQDSFTLDDFGNPQSTSDVISVYASIHFKLLDSRIDDFCDIGTLDLYTPSWPHMWQVYNEGMTAEDYQLEPPLLFTTIIDWINK